MASMLRVSLLDDSPEGRRFLGDIRAMLAARTRRFGAEVAFEPEGYACFVSSWDPNALASLSSEVGLHRAQLVPEANPAGRIVTVRVLVEQVSEAPPAMPPGPVLKTYNYPLGMVTRHATGERFDLDAVLAGEVG